MYASWACSLGDVEPIVLVVFGPTPAIAASCEYPPPALVGPITNEALSIVQLLAPLGVDDVPVLPGPLPGPDISANIHAKVAVTAVPQAISNPGPLFPVIHALRPGSYICHVFNIWRGAIITVPLFRS